MCEKKFELRQNSDGAWWLFNNENDSCLMISKNFASLSDICTVLNQLSDSNEGLILDRNRQEEKLDIAREKLSKQLEKIDEQQATIRRLQDLCGESDGKNAKLRIENKKLKAKLKEKEEDEQLYANEIVKLNKEAKEVLDFKSLGGDY